MSACGRCFLLRVRGPGILGPRLSVCDIFLGHTEPCEVLGFLPSSCSLYIPQTGLCPHRGGLPPSSCPCPQQQCPRRPAVCWPPETLRHRWWCSGSGLGRRRSCWATMWTAAWLAPTAGSPATTSPSVTTGARYPPGSDVGFPSWGVTRSSSAPPLGESSDAPTPGCSLPHPSPSQNNERLRRTPGSPGPRPL